MKKKIKVQIQIGTDAIIKPLFRFSCMDNAVEYAKLIMRNNMVKKEIRVSSL